VIPAGGDVTSDVTAYDNVVALVETPNAGGAGTGQVFVGSLVRCGQVWKPIDLPQVLGAGGDIADLCGDLDGDGLPDHGDCPACQIAGSADLPPTTLTLRDADLAFVAQVVAPRESRAVRSVLDPARGLRAPPLA
jgi:hypothetical protein